MSDPYIDPWETQSYGLFAREQMKDACLGLVSGLDAAVHFAIHAQTNADKAMKRELDRQPVPTEVQGDPVAEAADALVRFGSYLNSIKDHPVSPAVFFGNEAPSVAARRRLNKLTTLAGDIATDLPKYKAKLPGCDAWIDEFATLHARLKTVSETQRSSRTKAALIHPDLVAARESWLAVYTANKALITGILRHAGKPELLPLIFDDLAEIHHAKGVSDTTTDGAGSSAKPASLPSA